ncbi:MAG: HAD-IIIA family hydrolase [Thermodesulfovibrionia bacterium]|nr:HAD-IIIA family hydrolase [Thermodesulfovibrionia bacterium]
MPAIRAVRNAFPDAYISLLVKPWVAEIFKGNPAVNEIILYEDQYNSIAGKFKLAKILKSKGFNTAILLQNAFDAAFIAWLSRIPERIGYQRDFRGLLLTKAVPVKKTDNRTQSAEHRQKNKAIKQHHVYYYLNLLKESLNIEAQYTEPLLYLNEKEINQARNFLNSKLLTHNSQLLVGINPGAAYGSAKRWMPERFAELIHRIINELNGNVALFGSTSEIEIVNEIIKAVNHQNTEHRAQSTDTPLIPPLTRGDTEGLDRGREGILNLAGKTNLRELMALISECDAFISNDSGPMHIASALFVPVAAIFGSTDKAITGPLGDGHRIIRKDIPCSPCLERECPDRHLRCMTEISTDDVYNALLEILPKNRAVFLDKDGTLIEDVGYLNSFSDLKILEGVQGNLQRLKNAGFKLIGITNQSGVARRIVSEEFVKESNEYLQKTLGVDDFYYCPHHPDDECQCRKPKPMLLYKAGLKHRVKLKESYVIGDKTLDVLLANAVGAKGVLVLTGHDKKSEHADFIAKNLKDAVDWILNQEKT